jgi:hypothetical protein
MQLESGMARFQPRFSARNWHPFQRRSASTGEKRLVSEQETARCYYAAMRLEINQHLQIVNQIYTLYLAGVTALFAASMSRDGKYNLLLLLPFLSLGTANLLGSHERNIGCIAAYCASNLDIVLQKGGASVQQWDNSSMLCELKNKNFISNLFASMALVAAPGVVALIISIYKFSIINGFPYPRYPLVLLGWVAGLFCVYCTFTVIWHTAEYRKTMASLHKFAAQ